MKNKLLLGLILLSSFPLSIKPALAGEIGCNEGFACQVGGFILATLMITIHLWPVTLAGITIIAITIYKKRRLQPTLRSIFKIVPLSILLYIIIIALGFYLSIFLYEAFS